MLQGGGAGGGVGGGFGPCLDWGLDGASTQQQQARVGEEAIGTFSRQAKPWARAPSLESSVSEKCTSCAPPAYISKNAMNANPFTFYVWLI